MRRAGFTLVELLLVLAIIGILGAVLGWTLLGWLRAGQLQDAGTLIASELRRARSAAQSTGQPQRVTWTARSFSAGAGRNVALPAGITLTTPMRPGLAYVPPFGIWEIPAGDEDAGVWVLEGASGRRAEVVAVGITGAPRVRLIP